MTYLSPANIVTEDILSFFESKINASIHGIEGITCILYVDSGTLGIFLRRQFDFTPNVCVEYPLISISPTSLGIPVNTTF